MAKQPKGELVVLGFDYSPLDDSTAEQARSTAGRIRERLKKTLEDLIEVGSDLLAVKEVLPHGQFGVWLKAEFGWSERTAQNFMSVAERFKSANFAELPIQPSAAYLLAAPAVPDEARQVAVEKAEAGRSPQPRRSWPRRRRRGRGKRRRSPRTSSASGWSRCWNATRSNGTRRRLPILHATCGNSPTPWRSRIEAGRRRPSDEADRGGNPTAGPMRVAGTRIIDGLLSRKARSMTRAKRIVKHDSPGTQPWHGDTVGGTGEWASDYAVMRLAE